MVQSGSLAELGIKTTELIGAAGPQGEILKAAIDIAKPVATMALMEKTRRLVTDKFQGQEQQVAQQLESPVQQNADRQGHGKKKFLIGAVIGSAAAVGGILALRDPNASHAIGELVSKAGPVGEKAFSAARTFATDSKIGNAVGKGAENAGNAIRWGKAGAEYAVRNTPGLKNIAGAADAIRTADTIISKNPAAKQTLGKVAGEVIKTGTGMAATRTAESILPGIGPAIGAIRTADTAINVLRQIPGVPQAAEKSLNAVKSVGPDLLVNTAGTMMNMLISAEGKTQSQHP